jgi:hypothetical protein
MHETDEKYIYILCQKNLRGQGILEELGVNGRIILKQNLNRV